MCTEANHARASHSKAIRFEAAPEGANILTGMLQDTVYLGEVAQHQFQMGGTALKAFELNPKRVADGGAGAVRAWVASEDVMILG